MLTLPPAIMAILSAFAPLFSRSVWPHVLVLLVGAILAPGQRMVTSVLRALGLDQLPSFQTYHRVLNRDVWSSLQVSRVLLGLLVTAFALTGPLVVGIDETIERRRGAKIAAKGIYRDPVRSSHGHFVKASGLRWISLMLLVPIPWASRTWALPFLTVLAPSERYAQERRRRHKTIPDWARQMILLLHRWLPHRRLVLVGDDTYAAIPLLARCRAVATIVTRLRLDARLFAPPPARHPGQKGRPRIVGQRLPTLVQRRDDPRTPWTELVVPHWYGQGDRTVEICSDTALWYHPGLPPVPLRWVLIRDPGGHVPDPSAPVHRPGGHPAPDPVLVRPAVAAGGDLPRGPSAPRRRDESANGRTAPLPAPYRPYSASSRSSPCWPIASSRRERVRPSRPPGMPRRHPPSPMPSRWSVAPSGSRRVFACPGRRPT